MLRTSDKRLFVGVPLKDIISNRGGWQSVLIADSPKVLYAMDDASGSPQDTSGNGNHITTVIGALDYRQSATGAVDASIKMDSGESMSRALVSSVTTNFTVECLINLTSSPGGNNGWITYFGNGSNGWALGFTAGRSMYGLAHNVNYFSAAGTTPLSTSTWYHCCWVRDASDTWRYYLNGNADGTGGTVGPSTPTTTTAIKTGPSQNDFGAYIAAFAMYETAFDGSKVLQHYQALAGI